MAASLTMEALVERFTAWASARPDVRALAIVGSRARADRPADEWSDLDLVAVVTNPEPYLADGGWLTAIAPPRLTFLEPTAVGGQVERRVMFDGALDVDVSFIPASVIEQFNSGGLPEAVADVLQRGIRLLLDRDRHLTGMVARLPSTAVQDYTPPSVAAFDQAVNDFLYHAVWCAKKLYRGELWIAKQSCDGYLKQLLRQMIEWHAQAHHGWQLDTWHNGRFLDQWAAPEALAVLPQTFAAYNPQDIKRAVLATVDLYGTLAAPVAAAIEAPYPHESHRYVREWIEEHEWR